MGLANSQGGHYERILGDYNAHYFDKWSMRYRNEFVAFGQISFRQIIPASGDPQMW